MQVMERAPEVETGRVVVTAKLFNEYDRGRVRAGEITPDQVRTVEVQGLIDTGATMLVLPKDIVQQLGVPVVRQVTVTYADERKANRGLARGIVVEILGRDASVDAIVEPAGAKVLIGQVPLEVMDLVVDPKKGTIGPRPESPDSPLIEIY